jgi:DNA replication protein DnaC
MVVRGSTWEADSCTSRRTAAQADDLYELITERAGRSLILTSNRAPDDWYPLFPNPVVAESLLDRLIGCVNLILALCSRC